MSDAALNDLAHSVATMAMTKAEEKIESRPRMSSAAPSHWARPPVGVKGGAKNEPGATMQTREANLKEQLIQKMEECTV